MTIADSRNIARSAQRLIVEVKQAHGSPPSYDIHWQGVRGALVENITINPGARPSSCQIWFPDRHWEEDVGFVWSDQVRVRTDEPVWTDRTVLFQGIVTALRSGFSGGDERSAGFERNCICSLDHRWLMARLSPIYGQRGRSADDYTDFGTPAEAPTTSHTFFSGRRCIFNADGKPNRDPIYLHLMLDDTIFLCEMPIFTGRPNSVYWTAREMITYLMAPPNNLAYNYMPIADPSKLPGLSHSDFDKVLSHIVVEGLDVVEAVESICRHVGWSFRLDSLIDNTFAWIFYKSGDVSEYIRSSISTIILHDLYAPAVGSDLVAAVSAGEKMLWSMDLDEDITELSNTCIGLGAPDRFEFTAELVPAWLDSEFNPDPDIDKLFFHQKDIQRMVDDGDSPNDYKFYRYYHSAGSDFQPNVGRKWALNESGRYTAGSFDRGVPFDFAAIIPFQYALSPEGWRLFGPFDRVLSNPLTQNDAKAGSVGILVEFSFDGGSTWRHLDGAMNILTDECGIYISEPNLSDMEDDQKREIDDPGSPIEGAELNYFSSIADDNICERIFKTGEWRTRVRVTACVQMDQRLSPISFPSKASGSPFNQASLIDFSDRYSIAKRTASSYFAGLGYVHVDESNSYYVMKSHLDLIRRASEDMSICGIFTLERLWLGDGSGIPDFLPGDCIAGIKGRNYGLSKSFAGGEVWPEIVQIIYHPQQQKMQLVTRDLRFSRRVEP